MVRVMTFCVLAAALLVAEGAAAQIAKIAPPPIPNGLSGPGGTETFTPSPLPSVNVTGGIPYTSPVGAGVQTRHAPVRMGKPRVRR